MSSKPKQFTTSKVGETRHKPRQFDVCKTGDRPTEVATLKKMSDVQPVRHGRIRTWCSRGTVLNDKHELNESQLIKHESNESDINYNNELKQFAVCWTGDWPEKKNKPTHFTINLVCALGKVQRVGTGLTQTVPPQAPMRGLSALNGDLKDLRSQARAPDELPH